ncbi:MAG: N-acetylmuramoyl-L-alanine amidase, partial [Pseudomonadota bacterium]
MSNVKYLFVHTAAADIPNVDADKIKGWHLDRGWSDIGYHYVILDDRHASKADGTVEKGRTDSRPGAHVKGVNSVSLGICCAGHGDHRPFTAAQMASLVDLLARLARKHEIDPANVLGHREVNALVDRGDVDERY